MGRLTGRLTDRRILDLIIEALENGSRGCIGYVIWKQRGWEWIATNLQSQTQRSIADTLLSHVLSGAKIDQVREKREGHEDDAQFHYDFRIRIDDTDLYVETVLDETKTGPVLRIVNVHLK